MTKKKITENKSIIQVILFAIVVATMFTIAGTMGRYLFNELRPCFWYGFTKAKEENIRVERTSGNDIIFSNGERINGDMMMPYNLVAAILVIATFWTLGYLEILLVCRVTGYDIHGLLGPPTPPDVGSGNDLEKNEKKTNPEN